MKSCTAGIVLGLLALVSGTAAQTPAEFYKGKQIKFIVGTSAGQDYDLWSR
jgi:hypothetical protein